MVEIQRDVYDLEGKVVEKITLPKIFKTTYKPEVIKKAFLVIRSIRRQPYGADPLAGKRSSAHYHGKRHYRYTMMNREMARMPRIHGNVGFLSLTARVAPHVVKGRKAHSPKAEKKWAKKINAKEYLLALKSSIAASSVPELVKQRHSLEKSPIIFVDDFASLKKTKDVFSVLKTIISSELERCKIKKVRAGKGKMRGRRYKRKKGPLIIVPESSPLIKSAKNIPGIDVATLNNLDIELLAPGGQAGRILILTKSVLNELENFFKVNKND